MILVQCCLLSAEVLLQILPSWRQLQFSEGMKVPDEDHQLWNLTMKISEDDPEPPHMLSLYCLPVQKQQKQRSLCKEVSHLEHLSPVTWPCQQTNFNPQWKWNTSTKFSSNLRGLKTRKLKFTKWQNSLGYINKKLFTQLVLKHPPLTQDSRHND